jgi:hypothetical protein
MIMTHGWTPERRAKQRIAIQRWQPWQYSTGAKTMEGKRRVSRNAYKGGVKPQLRNLAKLLRAQKKQIGKIDSLCLDDALFNQNIHY